MNQIQALDPFSSNKLQKEKNSFPICVTSCSHYIIVFSHCLYLPCLKVPGLACSQLFLFPNSTAKSCELHSKQLHLSLKVHQVHCLTEFSVSKQQRASDGQLTYRIFSFNSIVKTTPIQNLEGEKKVSKQMRTDPAFLREGLLQRCKLMHLLSCLSSRQLLPKKGIISSASVGVSVSGGLITSRTEP